MFLLHCLSFWYAFPWWETGRLTAEDSAGHSKCLLPLTLPVLFLGMWYTVVLNGHLFDLTPPMYRDDQTGSGTQLNKSQSGFNCHVVFCSGLSLPQKILVIVFALEYNLLILLKQGLTTSKIILDNFNAFSGINQLFSSVNLLLVFYQVE